VTQRGWWGWHDYSRRAVSKDVEEFPGWGVLMELADACETSLERAFIAALFLTGSRVSEALQLRGSSFEVLEEDGLIICRGVTLLKRYHKLEELPDGSSVTGPLETNRRPFPILLAEPLTLILVAWLEKVRSGYLFPSPRRPGKPLTRAWAYKLSGRLQDRTGVPCWPHAFRSWRASQLVQDYGFEVLDLIDFFTWEKLDTALGYTRRGPWGLAKKMRPLPQYLPQAPSREVT